MSKRFHAALAAALSLLVASPAVADYPFQAGGQTITQGATVVGGKSRSHFILYDAAGNPVLTSGNPGFFSITGAVPLPTGAATAAGQATANASLGAPTDTAWDGAAASASQPSILKAIWSKLSGLLTVDTVVRSTASDRGGTIAAGGTAQSFMAQNLTRRGYEIQNQSTGDLYVNCQGTAAPNQTSRRVPAGATYESNPHHSGTGACSIYGATTAQAFFAREF